MPLPASIPLPQMRLDKRKTRSQIWEMYTEDGRSVDIELVTLVACCDDPSHGKAFLLDAQNQYTNERGYWVQIGWDRSCMPLCPIEDTKILGSSNKPGVGDDEDLLTQLVDQLFHEAKEQRQESLWGRIGKNTLLDKLTWLIAIPCGTALIAFAMIVLRHK